MLVIPSTHSLENIPVDIPSMIAHCEISSYTSSKMVSGFVLPTKMGRSPNCSNFLSQSFRQSTTILKDMVKVDSLKRINFTL